jgi:hypothetical protein
MTPFRYALVALLLATSLAAPASAIVVGGGGSATTDCLLVFSVDANDPPAHPHNIRCADGDPCDLDGTVNGVCQFAVAACANSTALPRCTLNGVQSITVQHAEDNGDPRFDPEFQALQSRITSAIDPPSTDADQCTTPSNFLIPVRGPLANGSCKSSKKTVKIATLSVVSGGKIYKDSDKIKLTCDPAPAGCDPRAFYSGTFDRIQKQVFDQSCAVSGCHDSQTNQANLVLETGAAYGNLVDVTPTNGSVPSDWKRVLPGDSSRSFIYHKVTGDLTAGEGAQMPFGGPALDQHLIDIIMLWIDGNAPDTGWVPGTDG